MHEEKIGPALAVDPYSQERGKPNTGSVISQEVNSQI